MEQYKNLLLEVWREACRHIEIEQSAATIAQILTHHMPLDRLVVLGFDWHTPAISLRAVGLGLTPEASKRIHRLQPAEKKRLLTWARGRDVLVHKAGEQLEGSAALMLADQPDGLWLIGVLWDEREPTGALMLQVQPSAAFNAQHVLVLDSLLEPFAVALENDRRVHELNALREAAEADKRSALSRLGRTELSDTIIGIDGGLRPVMDRVSLIAKSDMPVLILGETGSGKEIIARTIHKHSPRTKKPFIRINCGAIAPELIDSELFGHEKGAFTGAIANRRGWFERADEGTLLLDEIGELPLPAQVRLLRVLQEGTFERVGGEQLVKVDVRIVVATHRDLPAMVQNGKFREDLWYRICGFPIVLPPLRERKEDIPALVEHFVARAARRFGLKPQLPSNQDLDMLFAYNWPGNIREFATVIDRAAILGDGKTLEIARALGYDQTPTRVSSAASVDQSSPKEPSAHLGSLDYAMRHHIEFALQQSHGRVEGSRGAARILQINPHTLRARMRKLGIDWGRFRDSG